MHWIEALPNTFLVIWNIMDRINGCDCCKRWRSPLIGSRLGEPEHHYIIYYTFIKSKQNDKHIYHLSNQNKIKKHHLCFEKFNHNLQWSSAVPSQGLLEQIVILCSTETTHWSQVNLKTSDLESAKFNICAFVPLFKPEMLLSLWWTKRVTCADG